MLEAHSVSALQSPSRAAEYNGSRKAGHRGPKTRVRHLAARAGRPGEWTCEDVECARCSGNEHGRPFGRSQPTPDEAWAGRVAPTADERKAFRDACAKHLEALRASRDSEPGCSRLALERRTAVSRALVELGYLQLKTRSIPLGIPLSFSEDIR